MARLKLTLAYTGTAYAGWQLQEKGARTIQGELERALACIAGCPVRVHGAGRTDSGVHAEGQVAHADVPDKPVDWARALNALLPRDIRVLAATPAAPSFHARFSATGKFYAYALWRGHTPVPPRLEPFVWNTPPLNPVLMEEAAAMLVGYHDFSAFMNAGTPVQNTVRELWSIRREEGTAGPFSCPRHWPVETWFFYGNGFLKQMVRNLISLLVFAGQSRIPSEGIAACLAACDRRALPCATAPARGLTLMGVEYGERTE